MSNNAVSTKSMLTATPRWMKLALRAAGAFNIACGVVAVIFPTAPFQWGGLAPPNHAWLVQMLGMITVVFGFGYLLAARDPIAHWRIVALGFFGKLGGATVFLWTAITGDLPWHLALFGVANELVWWTPIAIIVGHIMQIQNSEGAPLASSLAAELQRTHLATGETLWDASFRQPLLIVFVRHLGCTFCREALDDLRQQGEQIASAGVTPIVVHMTGPEEIQPLLDRYGLKDVAAISDPDRRLFRAFELPLGTWNQLIGPRVFWRGVMEGVLFRHGFGTIRGNPWQLTGAFLVHRGEVVRSFRSQTTAERTNYADMACSVNR